MEAFANVMSDLVFQSSDVEATMEFGSALAATLIEKDVVALSGDLGAGKTHLCKGIAVGLGVDPDIVNSPTFVLLQQYDGRLPVYHFDTYRLGDVGEFEDIGGVELLEHDGLCLIEWPQRIEEVLPSRTIWVELTATAEEQRTITIRNTHPRAQTIIDALR